MPPKGKGGGKKKAERERQEAEDARQKAEEDARLLEIRSKKERELKDLKEKEILEHIFKQEAERLAQEETEISQIEHLNNTAVLNIIAEQDEEDDVNLILIQWLLHIACKILPNVKVEADVNTYLSILSRESLVIEDHPSMNPLINQLENISSLYTLLETQLWLSKDAQNSTQFNRYNNHLLTLHEIVSRKCDELSADVLQHTDYLSVEANENFQLTAGGKGFKYGIWGNATKNPRLSVIDFASQNLSLSLPKPLALSNVAIRLIYEDHSTISTIFQEQVVQDKLHMSLVGGILRMDLVDFPEAPRTVESWTLRQILSPEGYLLPITYPFKKVVLENVDAEQEQPDATSWASLVSYLIPPQTFVSSENVKVMYFDDNKWCDDDISDVEVDVGSYNLI